MSMVTYPFSHGVDRKAPRGTYVVRRLATLDSGTAKRGQLSTFWRTGIRRGPPELGWKRGQGQ